MVSHSPCFLQIDDLSHGYPQRGLFSHLSARFGAGIHLVRGGDGRGKTTLLRLLAGELAPQGGGMLACGVSSRDAPAAYRQQVFWLDPRTEAHDQQTAAQCFDVLTQRYPRFDLSQVPALFEGLALAEHAHKPLYMLSTGSKRKVWLTAAFASGAPVVLLDVPFASLDKVSIAFLTALLGQEAAAANRTWVLADYEAPPALALASTLDLGD